MISFEPLWETMKDREITKYQLINHYGFSSNTIRRLQRNEPASTTTLNKLCLILECELTDIITYTRTPEEDDLLIKEKQRISDSRKVSFL